MKLLEIAPKVKHVFLVGGGAAIIRYNITPMKEKTLFVLWFYETKSETTVETVENGIWTKFSRS